MRTLRPILLVGFAGASACGGAVFSAGDNPVDGGVSDGAPVDTSASDGERPDTSPSEAPMSDVSNPKPTPDAASAYDAGGPDAIATADALVDAAPGDAAMHPPMDAGDVAPCLTGGNVLYLDGDPGDYIHPGVVTITAATWSPSLSPATAPSTVSIHLVPTSSSQGQWWDADFSSAKLGQPLMLQTYTGAQRLPFAAAGAPGLEVTGDGRGCNTIVGTFTIRDLQVSSGSLTSFTASFVQHCEGGSTALRGCVHVGQ
jgi:hypothetical protein